MSEILDGILAAINHLELELRSAWHWLGLFTHRSVSITILNVRRPAPRAVSAFKSTKPAEVGRKVAVGREEEVPAHCQFPGNAAIIRRSAHHGPLAATPFTFLMFLCLISFTRRMVSSPSICSKMLIESPPLPWLTANMCILVGSSWKFHMSIP